FLGRATHWCCFFFFQAEDGIRDFHVTGVQTCALPILHQGKRFVYSHNDMESLEKQLERASRWVENTGGAILVITEGVFGMSGARSEERRVGKGCRARWGPREARATEREG